MDEIPAALRERKKTHKSTSINLVLLSGILGLGIIVLLLISLIDSRNQGISNLTETKNQANVSVKTTNNSQNPPDTNTTNTNNQELDPEYRPNSTAPENLLGHLPYDEASPSELKSITRDGKIKLKASAAQKFKEMQRDATASGVSLFPISGFRSISEQEYLFFQVKEQRGQVTSKRAEVSAPPGYSEHHTGYALDIGDGKTPATNLSRSFEKTTAYQWLKKNAAKYSFELSFIPDNLQGVSYEPWHWRYVGDTKSLETFYKARNLKSKLRKQ